MTARNLTAYELNPAVSDVVTPPIAAAKAWVEQSTAAATGPLIDLAQAVPNYPPPPALMDHLAGFVHAPESAFYTDILGLDTLRQTYAAELSGDYAGAIGAEAIAITPGCNNAYCLVTMALAGPGDEIILPTPYYFNHDMWLAMTGVKARLLPSRPCAQGMLPDPAQARRLIGPRTRALLLVTPNNPTGTIYPPAVIESFAELAREHGIALILDETYKDFRDTEAAPHHLFTDPDWADYLIHLYSFSKAYSLAGYRVGAITAGPALIEAVGKIADTLNICASRVGQAAALYGLEHLADWRRGKRQELLELLNALEGTLGAGRTPFALTSSGAFFAYLRHPFPDHKAIDVARALVRDQAVLALPGSFFGPDQEQFLRLAFANTNTGGLAEAARRLAAFEFSG